MSHKVLTAAIAAALAAPMAAQAVDFTISGQVNRALFITETDGGTSAEVANNLDWSTRIRANGRSELEGGGNVRIQFEYEESGSGVNLRHANVQYGGDFGRVTLGQGSEAGDGSQYLATTGVNGIGHGAGTSSDFTLGDWFGDLDGGGRIHMIRYDTPAIGPVSAAVSVGNDDQVSARLGLNTEVAGSSFAAQIATKRNGGGSSNISASFGSTLASGLTVSGAWAKGSDVTGTPTDAMDAIANTPAMPAEYMNVWATGMTTQGVEEPIWKVHLIENGVARAAFFQAPLGGNGDAPTAITDQNTNLLTGEEFTDAEVQAFDMDFGAISFDREVARLQEDIAAGEAETADSTAREAAMNAAEDLAMLFEGFACEPSTDATMRGGRATTRSQCGSRLYNAATDALMDGSPAVAAMPTTTDPSYFQVEIGYLFGNTGVAVSWYQSSDFMQEGSSGTALGIGARHTLPKAGADIYAALQNYAVKRTENAASEDETVVMIGTRVTF